MELNARFNGECTGKTKVKNWLKLGKEKTKKEKDSLDLINEKINIITKEEYKQTLELLDNYGPLLSADEVTKVLGICKKNVINNLIKPGILPNFGLLKRGYSVKKTDLASFLTSNNFLPNVPTRGIIKTNNN